MPGTGAPAGNDIWHYRYRCPECKTVERLYRNESRAPCYQCGSSKPPEKIVTRLKRAGFMKSVWEVRGTIQQSREA